MAFHSSHVRWQKQCMIPPATDPAARLLRYLVANHGEHDLFLPMVIHIAAGYLVRRFIRGASYIGRRTSVGTKRVVNIVVSFKTQSLSVEEVSHLLILLVWFSLDESSNSIATYLIRPIAFRVNQPNACIDPQLKTFQTCLCAVDRKFCTASSVRGPKYASSKQTQLVCKRSEPILYNTFLIIYMLCKLPKK